MPNVGIPAPPQNQDEGAPLMGLYFDRPAYKIDPKGFSACNNVRIERGRVRSDFLGWQLSNIGQLPGPCVYLSVIVNSFSQRQIVAATSTDIIFCNPGGTNIYMTPTVALGQATVTNGSATVTGVGTRWATDIQFGDRRTVQTAASAGAQQVSINTTLVGVPTGLTVTCVTNPGAVAPGTYLYNYSIPSSFVILSQPLLANLTTSDVLQFGNGIKLRQNLRAGDQISFGSNTQNAINAVWYTVQSVQSDTQLTLTTTYASASGSALYTGRQLLTNTLTGPAPYLPSCFSSNFPAAGGFSNSAPPGTTFSPGGDAWLFTNGVDPVVVFNSAYPTSCFYARSIPFVCASLRQSRGIMIYGGLTEPGSSFSLGSSIASSDNGFPLQLAGGVSFQGQAIDGPFQITRISVLGSTIMLYASGSMSGSADNQDDLGGCVVSASFVGFPTIWAFSDVIKTRGPLNGGCVAEFPDRHQFLAADGEYRYNGLFIQVMNDQVWRQVLKTYDATRPGATFSAQVTPYGDLIWAIPLLTDPSGQLHVSTAFVEHYMEQANSYLFKPITQRDFPFTGVTVVQTSMSTTWSQITTAWNVNVQNWSSVSFIGGTEQVFAGDLNGNIWQLYVVNTQAGTPALATCTWGARVIGNARARALVTRVYPGIEFIATPANPVTITLALQDALAGPTTITDTQTFNPNYAGNRFTTHYRRGRVATVTISDQAGLGWVCDGYDFDWVTGGLR